MKILLLAMLAALGLTPPPNLSITVHDAAGRTFNVSAKYNAFTFGAGGQITMDITTDTLWCGGFEK